MKRKISTIIKYIFGTQNNILLKLNISLFISAILFYIFAILIKDQSNPEPYNTFIYISSILFFIWMLFAQYNNSIRELMFEIVRLITFFCILVFSLNFCINTSIGLSGVRLISCSILSCIGIIGCSFYLTSKFIDIFALVKKIFTQIKQKLFDSDQPSTSKIKSLIENITAFLVSIAGLGVAIKAIIEPLINLFMNN